MKKTGFYIIKDKFFEDMSDPYLKGNKAGNRPHYYCFEDTGRGIYWMNHVDMAVKGKICDTRMIPACFETVNTA